MPTTTTPLQVVNQTRGTVLAARLRLAETAWSRLRGLLATPAAEFGPGHGLWIHPSNGVHSLGMRYAIDALYLDRGHRVVHCAADLRPWRLAAVRRRAAGVLELPAGTIAATGTRIGDQIDFTPRPARFEKTL